ncbi:MAG: PaaI family thioesterase [Anaerolineales bacterium]|nr:PaaI family thioesterase [Anaerolineales bacterium]
MTEGPAFQDFYTETYARCYGCGRLNPRGLHIRSRWEGDETVSTFVPRPEHTAIPGFVYGGLIASLIDCHSTGTAAGAALRARGAEPGTAPMPRFVTGSLHVEYLRPTPLGPTLEIRGMVKEIKGRKVVVTSTLGAEGVVCARGEVVAVEVPEDFGARVAS